MKLNAEYCTSMARIACIQQRVFFKWTTASTVPLARRAVMPWLRDLFHHPASVPFRFPCLFL